MALDKATDPWGVKVLRYEIKIDHAAQDVLAAMEKQMRAEREKRAVILTSEGDRDSKINRAEGVKQETIKNSEANRPAAESNEAEGRAQAILARPKATSEGLKMVSDVFEVPRRRRCGQAARRGIPTSSSSAISPRPAPR
jgi:regulator of protease activity HflC (stomatin/prohibitin superfamily)